MDVGAEAGRISQLVKDRHLEAIGIDIEAYGLKRLRLKNPKVNLILSDARKIPMRRRVLDAIFMIEVLDYIPELETVLSECRDALKPGGRLVLSFGNLSSLKSKFRLLRGRSYRHSYVRVLRCLAKTRFTIIRQTGYNWLPFSRVSDIPVIPTLAKAERFLGLRRMCGLSPWVLVCAVKSK
jgi:ubiquinone/menaquinone biosynthesis C-methylase UbiE